MCPCFGKTMFFRPLGKHRKWYFFMHSGIAPCPLFQPLHITLWPTKKKECIYWVCFERKKMETSLWFSAECSLPNSAIFLIQFLVCLTGFQALLHFGNNLDRWIGRHSCWEFIPSVFILLKNRRKDDIKFNLQGGFVLQRK